MIVQSRSLLSARVDRRHLVLTASGTLLAIQCAGQTGAIARDAIVATMVTDTAGIGDESFNDLAREGGNRAAEELGVEFEVIESERTADYVRNLIDGAEQGNLTIAIGFLLEEALGDVASQYPDKYFSIIDTVVEGDNIVSFTFREQEGSFLAGVLAALMTKSGTIGFLGGIRLPPVMRYEVGYVAGAKSINPDIEFLIAYADDFEDSGLGKELALAQYDNGADIVLAAAGRSGTGAFDAASEKGEGVYVIAADQDQSDLGTEHQLAAVIKRIDTGVYDAIEAVRNGSFESGTHDLGISEDGVGIGAFNDVVTKDMKDTLDAYRAAIVDGSLVPPVDDGTLETFEPIASHQLGGIASPEASPAS